MKVTSALAADKMMDLTMVKVAAIDDAIYLSGTVQTGAQRGRAAFIASRVEGVKLGGQVMKEVPGSARDASA